MGIPVGEQKLSNPNASDEAVELYSYICNVYENHIISGQQESTWIDGEQYEFEYIYEKTGKYPAIRGLDYMNDDFEETTIPYPEIIKLLQEHNWDGYLLSEYEGADKYDDGYEVGLTLRKQHIMLKNLLGD
jgi:hypothetical protein